MLRIPHINIFIRYLDGELCVKMGKILQLESMVDN